MQAGHDGADRDVEDLRRVRVGEVADVDEHEHVAEVVRHLGERLDDVVLREPLDDALLVGRLALRLLELVREVVVALPRAAASSGVRWIAAAAVDVQVGEDPQQPGAQVRAGVNDCQLRNARA